MAEGSEPIRLVRGDVVVVAASHNPSILSPDWVAANLTREEHSQFVHTSEFSLWDSPTLQLTVDRARFQVAAKQPGKDGLARVQEVSSAYVRILEHVPFTAVGLNWVFVGAVPTLSVSINDHPVPSALSDYAVSLGATIIGSAKSHRIKLVIEPAPDAKTASFNLNAHFDVKSGEAADAIERFLPMTETVYGLVLSLLGQGAAK